MAKISQRLRNDEPMKLLLKEVYYYYDGSVCVNLGRLQSSDSGPNMLYILLRNYFIDEINI